MKTILILNTLLLSLTLLATAQETLDKTMEKRAREMHRVIKLTDPEDWKKFIQENYTQALIDKPMRAKVETIEDDQASSESRSLNNLEGKAQMFRQLNQDFGNSEIVSIQPNGEMVEMKLKDASSGMTGIFNLQFEKKKPYLISGIGIQVGN